MDTPLEECERRDTKGLYKKARSGKLRGFTGIDQAYERPDNPELIVKTVQRSVAECVKNVLRILSANSVISEKVCDDAEAWFMERRNFESFEQVKELFVPRERMQQVQVEAKTMPDLEISELDLQWLQVRFKLFNYSTSKLSSQGQGFFARFCLKVGPIH